MESGEPRKIDPVMQAALDKLIKVEELGEEILLIREQHMEYHRKREHNREGLGALRRGEVQTSNKLWMIHGDTFLKLPRKSLLSAIESEQHVLTEQIDKCRKDLKLKTKELLALEPALVNMDPYVVSLLT